MELKQDIDCFIALASSFQLHDQTKTTKSPFKMSYFAKCIIKSL